MASIQRREAQRSARMAFNRTLELGTGNRPVRTDKVPQEIKARPELKNKYFELWLASKCSWGIVTLTEEIIEKESSSKRSVRRWMNKSQLLAHFLVPSVVSAIIEEKQTDPDGWRPYPDAPTCVEAREYFVLVVDEADHELSYIKSKVTKLTAQLDEEAGQSLLDGRLAKPAWMYTLGVFNGGQSAAVGNNEEEKRKELEKQQARQQKIEEAKVARERERNTPAGQAKAWLTEINKSLDSLTTHRAKSQTYPKTMPAAVCAEYVQIFTDGATKLEECKQVLNTAISSGELSEQHKKSMKESMEQVTTDTKNWKKLLKVYKVTIADA